MIRSWPTCTNRHILRQRITLTRHQAKVRHIRQTRTTIDRDITAHMTICIEKAHQQADRHIRVQVVRVVVITPLELVRTIMIQKVLAQATWVERVVLDKNGNAEDNKNDKQLALTQV